MNKCKQCGYVIGVGTKKRIMFCSDTCLNNYVEEKILYRTRQLVEALELAKKWLDVVCIPAGNKYHNPDLMTDEGVAAYRKICVALEVEKGE